MTDKRLVLTQDGIMTYCTASEENIGKGRCNHVLHGDPKDMQGFMEKAKHYNKNFKIDDSIKSNEESSVIVRNAPKYPVNTDFLNQYYKECCDNLWDDAGYCPWATKPYESCIDPQITFMRSLCDYNIAKMKHANGKEVDLEKKKEKLDAARDKAMKCAAKINALCSEYDMPKFLDYDGKISDMDPKEFDKSILDFARGTRFGNC